MVTEPESGDTSIFGTLVSDIQTDVVVSDDDIAGTLSYYDDEDSDLVKKWGAGNFLALKFGVPEGATSCKVGLDPSEGSGLVEIIDDPDRNGVFKITDKDAQEFMVKLTVNETEYTQTYGLDSLVCETE